jgi:hypothetical protein
MGPLPTRQSALFQAATLSESPLQTGMPGRFRRDGYCSHVGDLADNRLPFIPRVANHGKRITANLR